MASHQTHITLSSSHRFLISVCFVLLILILQPQTTTALDTGNIQSLTATTTNNDVNISWTLRANVALLAGNLYFEVRTPGGAVIGSKSVSTPLLLLGQSTSNSTTITVSAWPDSGNYTVYACWSIGLLIDCAITTKSTTFFHVPSLGLELMIASALILSLMLWPIGKVFDLQRSYGV